jgi:hypothetical protein
MPEMREGREEGSDVGGASKTCIGGGGGGSFTLCGTEDCR